MQKKTAPHKMSLKEAKHLIKHITSKWQEAQQLPDLFAYTLNVQQSKYLPDGKWNFYLEYNHERGRLRRVPQSIWSLEPVFDDEKFNFKKINPKECILQIPHGANKESISFIINRSPLTLYHTLICPAVERGYPQRITPLSLEVCVALLRNLNDRSYRIGYNSPGALASVNHLHLHLLHLEKKLYVDCVKLEPLPLQSSDESVSHNFIYKLTDEMPTSAICFIIYTADTDAIVATKLKRLYAFIEWLISNKMPHNIFMTLNEAHDLCIFIFAREEYCIVKDTITYNIGFCEVSGYVTVCDKELYDTLTEHVVIAKINEVTGNVYERIYNYFTSGLVQ